jgi:glutamate formiminotransferase/formiminotetrahydrofolate cyclodeaminase
LQIKNPEVNMATPIIECVPNFSEAKRPEVMDQIIKAITDVEGVWLLDQHSDEDHNRTVVTFVGSPQGVEEAAFQAIAKAATLIDLSQHKGEHPRIGATDVVPLIPISGVTMKECIQLSERLGERIAAELKIPVYLYEESARTPSRRNLAAIRKGEYETLKKVIEVDESRVPDFGPRQLGPAGATVIGAREFLIAYNIYLTTEEVDIAKDIARTVRHSSGGLRYVKALGMLVEGQAQVSMNLTNFRKTPISLVVETVRREAQRYGVNISHSELVGLIPQDALVDMAVWYAQMNGFDSDQVLEQKMYAAIQDEGPKGDVSLESRESFTDELAAGTPTPGGGSAAAYAGAMGAGLVAMVARLTLGKAKYKDVGIQMESILEETEKLREILNAAVAADSAAFEALMAANRLPKGTEEEKSARADAVQAATLEATQIPFQTARKSLRVMQLALQAAALGYTYAITDAGTAAALAQAAISGAGYNVRINALDLRDEAVKGKMLSELESMENRAVQFMTQLRSILKDRGGLDVPSLE